MNLTIISHSAHYRHNNVIMASNHIVRELTSLNFFDRIIHIAPLHSGECPGSHVPYNDSRISYVPIKPSGGNGLRNKLDIIYKMPYNIKVIDKECKQADWIHFRAPTNLGIYVLPYLFFFSKINHWIKYAGNWGQSNPPFSYRIQRWWLSYINKARVTINGVWVNQKNHILSFENPCLSEDEIVSAYKLTLNKKYEDKLSLCFVGNLVPTKGLDMLLDALKLIDDKTFIDEVFIVGDGAKLDKYIQYANEINDVKIRFMGSLRRSELNMIYNKSHCLILPSSSEGFPKVIAEASAFGCFPIVSKVGSIDQYINRKNGILLEDISVAAIIDALQKVSSDRSNSYKLSVEAKKMSSCFTYESYGSRIKKEIINYYESS